MGRLADSGRVQTLAAAAFLFGAFLAARLLLHAYVSEHWIGSLGAISAMSAAVLLLARGGRMGWMGRAIMRKVRALRESRRAWALVGANAAAMYMLAFALAGLAFEPDGGAPAAAPGAPPPAWPPGWPPGGPAQPEWRYLAAAGELMLLPYTDFGAYVRVAHAVDAATGGWSTHFATVSLVEAAEAMAVLLYLKLAGGRAPRAG